MKNITLVNELKDKGFRITRVRKTMLSVLANASEPHDVSGLISKLFQSDISANKTTIYRELDFLKKQGIVREVEFGDGKKRYELVNDEHHHHVVCLKCGKVADIDFDVDLGKHEAQISKDSGFDIKEHSIEFFGYCTNCK